MPHWPKPWGRAADAVEQLVIEQEFRAARIKRPDYGITGWVILTLIQHGTPSQIDRFVDKALRKEEIWCQLFSEPDAGSDAAAIKTRAVRVDGGWKLNGQKVWTSGAHYCKRGLATVRTDPEAAKHAGITTVIIDMNAPGVQVRPLRMISGGSEFNEVFFNDVFVPDEDVVGEPNSGWTVARATLGNERVSIGGGSGVAGVNPSVVDRAGGRARGSVGGSQDPGRQLPGRRARDCGCSTCAARCAASRAAARARRATSPNSSSPSTWASTPRSRARCSARTSPCWTVPRRSRRRWPWVRAAMAIAGGTSEVTRNQIAERILGMPRDPLIK